MPCQPCRDDRVVTALYIPQRLTDVRLALLSPYGLGNRFRARESF